ncbi:GntR family transcriptional regulator [Pseudonocardia aurantiaca]|uniref:GntR family transcriptional regulator n=1 Tax=Pseudonocardia aurantiaca TaxID=75290 RepID=A0ABW4FL17_9PSEU
MTYDTRLATAVVPAPAKAADVYERVKALIMDSRLAPGVKINIDAVARDLEVSHTPLREALARLEADGLAVKHARRGYTAAPLLSRAELDELYDLRLLLEPYAAARAAERITDFGVERLEAELATFDQAPEDEGYQAYGALAAHDRRLHDLVLELAGNETVRTCFNRTHAHLHLYRLYYGGRTGNEAISEHRALADALTARDPRAAAERMREHLERSRDRLHRIFDSRP